MSSDKRRKDATKMFKAGDKVHLKPNCCNLVHDLFVEDFVVGAVVPLPNPDAYYVDPHYWGRAAYAWAREKTRLDVAGHPQVVFLEGVLEYDTGIGAWHHSRLGDPDHPLYQSVK